MIFVAAIRHNFTSLLRLAGREGRQSFWLYALFIFILTMVAGFAVFVLPMMNTIDGMQRFAAQHPDQATVTSGPGSYSIEIHGNHPELMPDVTGSLYAWTLVCLIAVFLLSAAVVRRLHDRGKAGAWGLMPLPFLAFGLAAMPGLMTNITATGPDMTMFGLLFVNNLVYLGTLIALIVLLAGPADPTQNRYGSPVS